MAFDGRLPATKSGPDLRAAGVAIYLAGIATGILLALFLIGALP